MRHRSLALHTRSVKRGRQPRLGLLLRRRRRRQQQCGLVALSLQGVLGSLESLRVMGGGGSGR
jgi:hypothetical protein